jgi:hypothetical protein
LYTQSAIRSLTRPAIRFIRSSTDFVYLISYPIFNLISYPIFNPISYPIFNPISYPIVNPISYPIFNPISYPGLACFLLRLRAVPTVLLQLLPAYMNALTICQLQA